MNLLFPSTCFHCTDPTENRILCLECLENFHLISPQGRCKKCFSSIPMREGTCPPCRKISHDFTKVGACFNYLGPISSLFNAYNTGYFRLENLLASYIVLQLHALCFDDFTIITTTTCPNLAKNVAKRLNTTYKKILTYHRYPDPKFQRKNKCTVFLERVLLLELKLDRVAFRLAGRALNETSPHYLYGIALCTK